MYEDAIRLALGQFGDGCELPRLQHPLPAKGPGKRLDQRVVVPFGRDAECPRCVSKVGRSDIT